MTWRVRTTLPDRPGDLARVATACGDAGVNIVSMQVFPTSPRVTDELVVTAPDGWDDLRVADLFEKAGGEDVVVVRLGASSLADPTTSYLDAVRLVLDEGRPVEDVLAELLGTQPPDVADYSGHDVLDLTRRDGTTLRISRAFAFTPVERARAQALVSLLGDAGADVPLIAPSALGDAPLVRETTLADIDAVAALHGRCSVATLYRRYETPLRMPVATRFARRLVLPEHGHGLAVQVGLDLVGHGVLERGDAGWTLQMLVEDAWQGRGLGTQLLKHAAGRAKAEGAEHLTLVSGRGNDTLLRTVGNAGFVARVERREGQVHVTVPLRGVRPL
ncbi:GNAT family N-acetyltransferase [Aeromicrobium massiliense]|uniref:GNAT family N-acetyltransferase n=1 Tax=Aeromicrobium massiliense TaxID=1464554 RepID=UPI000578AA11|nr:GNAT family N-acetyltransferase [Aeromicrobium massiliense]